MGGPPLGVELFNLVIREPIRFKFSPRAEAAHVSESKIAGFADVSFRAFLRVRAIRNAEYFTCGDAVRFIAWIAGSVKSAVTVELPLFSGDPRQHTRFDAREVRTY